MHCFYVAGSLRLRNASDQVGARHGRTAQTTDYVEVSARDGWTAQTADYAEVSARHGWTAQTADYAEVIMQTSTMVQSMRLWQIASEHGFITAILETEFTS